MTASLYWHDYETFGTDPRRDRPAQFAGVRTDEALNEIGEPLLLYCRPAGDYLPAVEACLLTGITPDLADRRGVPETEFIGRIEAELGRPGTCGVGYNSIRFDDEFTRNSLYRNLRDPYAREWRNGNSRWDLIDLVRMAYALRPQGLEWPVDEAGLPVFRLEMLTQANGIEHGQAHDALADVRATLALARLLRQAQPRLYDWHFSLRRKAPVAALLDPQRGEPLLHVSGMYPRELGCIAPVLSLGRHPRNANEYIVYDLRQAPDALIELDAEVLAARLYTPSAELAQGTVRPALKSVHANRSPALAPMNTLGAEQAVRWSIDQPTLTRHAEQLVSTRDVWQPKLAELFRALPDGGETDPDLAIYSGGFFSDRDRLQMQRALACKPEVLGRETFHFEDPRLPEMLFRFRARNYPETLADEDRVRWREFCRGRLQGGDAGSRSLSEFKARIGVLRESSPDADGGILAELEDYAERIESRIR